MELCPKTTVLKDEEKKKKDVCGLLAVMNMEHTVSDASWSACLDAARYQLRVSGEGHHLGLMWLAELHKFVLGET